MPTVSRFVSAASLMLAATASTAARAQTTTPGWMYTANMKADSGTVGRSFSMALKYQVTQRYLRMEFVQISGVGEVGSAEGMSYVVDDRDSSLTMFMPDQHTAMVTDMGAVLGSASAMRSGMTPKFTQHLTTNRMDDLGPGERILGHATHRYRLTTAGTMDVTIQGETCTKPVDAVSEMWMADDVDLMPVMQAMTKHFSAVGEVANMTQAASDAAKALPPGFPTKGTALRTVSRSTARGADGKTVPVTSTTEYVEMSQAPIPNSIFAVPSDYKVMDARKMMANLPAGVLDSSMTSTVAGMGESMKKAMCGPSR